MNRRERRKRVSERMSEYVRRDDFLLFPENGGGDEIYFITFRIYKIDIIQIFLGYKAAHIFHRVNTG
jgi:hypothetical protein